MDNRSLRVIRNAANDPIKTTSLNSGLLDRYQAKQFIRQLFDNAPLTKLVTHEQHRERKGVISKIGIGRRLLRAKYENVDDGYRAGVTTAEVEYDTVPIRLPWEITEETIRENIEGKSLPELITDMMTEQLGLDLEDLYLNGDEATPASDPDYDFLKLNDGWIKQIKEGGHVTDGSTASSGTQLLDLFDTAIDELPEKYIRAINLHWIMSPKTARVWKRNLRNQAIGHGGIVDQDIYRKPADRPVIETPFMPDDTVLLTDPKNLIVVNTYSVKVREDSSSKEAIMMDKRFYVTHLDEDTIVRELDATGIITGLKIDDDDDEPVAGE